MGLAPKVLPVVTKVAKKSLMPLATGVLSSLSSFTTDKILGRGQPRCKTGGFLIPQG